MGRDWKTLSVVIVTAAIAGWVVTRTLGGARHRVASPSATVAASPAPERTADGTIANTPNPSPVPSAITPQSVANGTEAAGDSDEAALIVRDLELLALGLVRDQRIEERVMARVNDGLDVPGVTAYRRGPDFWEAALVGTERGQR